MKPQSRAMLLALSRRGEAGVSAMDALFEMSIARAAARVWELRKEGFAIDTEMRTAVATYVLREAAVKVKPMDGLGMGVVAQSLGLL
jgi:hypothetical protein